MTEGVGIWYRRMSEDEFKSARKRMVAKQIAGRGVIDPRLLAVMESVPRHRFVSPGDIEWAHADGPLPIGYGQSISQPYIVALMTELLELERSARVLEVGTGSGYQAAVLASLAAEVHSLEIVPDLARQAAELLIELGYDNVHVHVGDGSLGWPEAAPYNGILVAAAAPAAPEPLLAQLAEGGRLVLPVGSPGYQQLQVWQREGERFDHITNIPVAFVPLRGKHGWK
jgi:protein-L-isoaspartate(D-aspartate) O-methyltransferase